MAYAHSIAPRAIAPRAIAPRGVKIPQPKRGLLARMIDAVAHSNAQRAEREIARYFSAEDKFTDATEREIERRFLS